MSTRMLDLPNQNVYGESFVDRKQAVEALEKLGLTCYHGWTRGSKVFFRGTLKTTTFTELEVEVVCYSVKRVTTGFQFVPFEQSTHLKIKGWMPSAIHLRGKGSRTVGWDIYEMLCKLLSTKCDFYEYKGE